VNEGLDIHSAARIVLDGLAAVVVHGRFVPLRHSDTVASFVAD